MECGEASGVIGIFKDKDIAEQNRVKYGAEQSKYWHGEHDFKIFEIDKLNKVNHIEYRR
jgi:hypothetical protein